MFIFPDPEPQVQSNAVAFNTMAEWHRLLSPLRLPLVVLLLFLVVRLIMLAVTWDSDEMDMIPVALDEKAQPAKEKKSWLGGVLSVEMVPSTEVSPDPATRNATTPPPMRGQPGPRVADGIPANARPLAIRPKIQAPLPAIYESKTPVSMAKMIMSRHTYRPPAARRSPSPLSTSHPRRISVR
ncbi:hypothetical protein MSAN_00955800 [Mycena sanguinolenta]|uniref:Transmembrane protein n=1 Tax=Mycena sanguinolenta TaxID=230812 RepID=A0A8H7DCW6_9AGAR|nr:hypothetical protein MSAN_00955800 [Mycena sanguinolenta]